MWSAIRYRRLQALVLLVLSALITACTVLAPLYDRAMQQALTRLTVDGALPRRVPMSRTVCPRRRRSAIVMRSSSDKNRAETGALMMITGS